MCRKYTIFAIILVFLASIATSVFAQNESDKKAVQYYNAGTRYAGQGNIEKAIIYFKKALDINQNYANAHYNLGKMYHIKAAIANNLNPDQPSSSASPKLNYKSKWEKGIAELDTAIKKFKEVIRLQPNAADA